MILSDNETRVDMINNRAIAITVVDLINESKDNPISIGIHGDWGSGKSSLLEMIEEELIGKNGVECIKFNGWKYQGFEDAKIALMSTIISELIRKRKFAIKCQDTIKKIWKNINWLNVAKNAGGIALAAITGIPSIGILSNMFYNTNEDGHETEKLEQQIIDTKTAQDSSIAKEFFEFQQAFEKLLSDSSVDKLVILIDDLDRCLPEITIDTLEAIRLFMFSKSTAFVIAADEAMIEYAVKRHFPNIVDNNLGQEFSKRYLEKLIQVPFRLPALGEVETKMYILLLMIGSKLSENNNNFLKLIKTSIEKLKKPWIHQGLSFKDLQEILAEDYDVVKNEIMIANQIYPILYRYTYGNPRKIKRFINMLLLRYRISEARGFGDEITLPILAKIMLVEYYMPEVYSEIAKETSDNGKCKLLDELEKLFSQNDDNSNLEIESNDNKAFCNKILDPNNNVLFYNWLNSEPLLGNIDLRPYYFACKEKEEYVFNKVQSDKLISIIAGLMSSSMNIANIADQVERLSKNDAKYVFDILSQKILSQGDISIKPKGIDGIKCLVGKHKELQSDLIGLILSFDKKKVGAWICGGWKQCITDETEKGNLKEYYNDLSINGNDIVKSILQNIMKGDKNGDFYK